MVSRSSLVIWAACLLACGTLATSRNAQAEVLDKSGEAGGLGFQYRVVLPDGYDAAKTYPALLAFGGGPQTDRAVDGLLANNLREQAEKRGWLVFAPIAPDGQLFFEEGARIFPQFLDQLLAAYHVEGGRFHVAGRSNGGLSAFHVASLYPRYFVSLTGFPGMLQFSSPAAIKAIAPLCIDMYVGGNDELGWTGPMTAQARELKAQGLKVRFFLEAGQRHGIATLSGEGSARLFDGFERARKGCKG
jgi:poly(3-hydroxybutyrate) depolymerase